MAGEVRIVRGSRVVLPDVTAGSSSVMLGGSGGYWERGVVTELMTVAAAASSTSVAHLLPANTLIEAVCLRVTVVIPTATSFTVGDGTTAARFGTGIAVAAGTTNASLLARNPANADAAGPVQVTDQHIVLTMAGGTPADNTGRVRVTVYYSRFVAPTS